jgi:hypothetical protein
LASCFDQEWINMNEIRMEPERLSKPFLPPTPPPRAAIRGAGTGGLRVAATLAFLLFLPGGFMHLQAVSDWMNATRYSPAPIPNPPVATAANLLASVILYSAARIVEGVYSASNRRPP